MDSMLYICMLVAALLSTVSTEILESADLTDFSHQLDMEGVKLIDSMSNQDSGFFDDAERIRHDVTEQLSAHSRKRRSSGVIMSMVKAAQKTGNREELHVRSAHAFRRIKDLYDPTDIIPIMMKIPGEVNPQDHPLFFAIANHRSPEGDFNSHVLILRFYEEFGNFSVHQALPAYAPYELESFNGLVQSGMEREFLAVSGFIEGDSSQQQTLVSIYQLGPAPFYMFTPVQTITERNVRALQYFEISMSTFLILGMYSRSTPVGQRYSSPSQLVVFRYDPVSNYFHMHSTLPGSGVSDIECFSVNKKTYLAVSNYRDDVGNLDIISYVYVFNEQIRLFELLQYIPTHGALDIEHFTLSKEDYFIVANEASGTVQNKSMTVDSEIYKLENGKFELVQKIDTIGAIKWKSVPVPNCRHDTLLVYGDQRDNIDQVGIYTFSHEREMFYAVPFSIFHLDSYDSNFRPMVTSLNTFTVQDHYSGEYQLYIILGSNNTELGGSLYRLTYDIALADSPLDGFIRDVDATLGELRKSLKDLEGLLDDTKSGLGDAVMISEPQTITGTKTFAKLQTGYADVRTMHVTSGSILLLKNGTLYRADPTEIPVPIPIDALETLISSLDSELYQIKSEKDQLILIDESTTSSGSIDFTSLEVKSLHVQGDLRVDGLVNDINLGTLQREVVKRTDDENLTGLKTFSQDVSIEGDLNVNEAINSIVLSAEAVLQGADQEISGTKTFRSNTHVIGDLHTGRINGYNISTDFVFLNRPADILGEKTFTTDVCVETLTMMAKTNNLSVDEVFSNTVSKTTPQNITGTKIFTESVKSSGDVYTESINGISLATLGNDAIKLEPNLLIGGKIEFVEDVEVSDMSISKTINGIRFPDQIVSKTLNQSITGKKTFVNTIQMKGDLKVSGFVDGMKTSDLVTLSTEQTLTGMKRFTSTIITNNVELDTNATINSIDISDFASNIIRIDTDETIQSLSFSDSLIWNNSHVKNKINNETVLSLGQLLDNSLQVKGNQVIRGHKMIDGNVDISNNLQVGKVNSFRIPDDFMTVTGDQIISVHKTFEDDVIFYNALKVGGLVDGVDVNKLRQEAVTINGNEGILGSTTFLGNVSTRSQVVVNGYVNGVDLSEDLMTLDTDQIITASKVFQSMSYATDHVAVKQHLHVSATIDGCDLSDLDMGAMTKTRDETVTGNLCFEQTDYNRSVAYVNDIDLSALRDDIVTVNSDQVIMSEKIFNDLVIATDLETTSTIDGVDVSEMRMASVLKDESAIIKGDLILKNVHVESDFDSGHMINNINISNLEHQLVSKSSNQSIRSITFMTDAKINDVTAEYVNTLDPYRDMVYRSADQTIAGQKTFLQQASLRHLAVSGKINGFVLEDVVESVAYKDLNQTINGSLLFTEDAFVNGDVTVTGRVDGIDLSEWNLVKLSGPGQHVTGRKVFTDPTTLNSIVAENVNEEHFEGFLDGVVTVSDDQTISGPITFSNGIDVESDVHVEGNLTVTSDMVNDINLRQLSQNILFTDGNQEMTGKTFTGGLSVRNLSHDGLLNGINIMTDLVHTYGAQKISGQKTFVNLSSYESIVTNEFINNVNTTDLRVNTLELSSETEQVVSGQKVFQTHVNMTKLKVKGHIDGIKLNDNSHVTLDTDQVISGRWTSVNDLTAKELVVIAKVDGVDLPVFTSFRVTLSSSQTITSPITFDGDVYVSKDIVVSGTVNGLDLSSWNKDSPNLQQDLWSKKDTLNETLLHQCQSLAFVQYSLQASPYRFDHLTEYQLLNGLHTTSMEYFVIDGISYIAATLMEGSLRACPTAVLLKKDPEGMFAYHQDLKTRGSRKVLFFTAPWGAKYLLVGNSKHECDVDSGRSRIMRWSDSSKEFETQYTIQDSDANDIHVTIHEGIVYLFLALPTSRVHVWAMHMYSLIAIPGSEIPHPSDAVTSFVVQDNLYYALAWTSSSNSSRGYVTISRVSSQKSTQIQDLPAKGASSVSSFESYGKTYLVIANAEDKSPDGHSTYNINVDIYMFSVKSASFVWFQSIPQVKVTHVETFTIGNTVYLAVSSLHHLLSIYEFGLELGFKEIYDMQVEDLRSTTYFEMNGEGFLALSCGNVNSVAYDQDSESRLLKVEAIGADTTRLEDVTLNC